jgi:hypothetical protein
MRGSAALPLAIERAGGVPADVADGLDLLERSPPLWPVERATWVAVVASVAAFADHWDVQARGAGWSPIELYGLHRAAPYANLSAMGAAFVLARSDSSAIAVSADAIVTLSRLGAMMRLYRFPLAPDAVLAWSLCKPSRGVERV